jgi:site-specific DNA recombinase
LETWSSHFIRQILDNPVYCGKIAYGRRTREKVKGTKNEYKQVHTDDYILEDGQHEGIVSAELWEKVRAKRIATGIKQPSKVGKDRSHLLTGVLKCPMCGSSMYTNKHAWTNKDGTYKEVYYYICGRNKQERGHHCDYKASLRKTDIEPLVIEAVKELVSDKYFAREIKSRIGIQTDTGNVDKEIANYESKLKEVDLNKARLEREIDNLPADARYRERKIHDMTLRLDGLYDTIVELEERIEDAKLRRSSIEMEAITLENVYKIMKNFGKLYAIMSDEEKKSVISYLIKEIQIYPNGESEMPLKSIEFNFPIYRDGKEVRKVLWERGNTVETVCLLSKLRAKQYIEIDLSMDELDLTAAESKATYDEIKAYVLEKHGLKVSSLYISQVKRKCGLDVGQNYNLSKKEDAKVPQCPPEKEAAIVDALRYFKMIV